MQTNAKTLESVTKEIWLTYFNNVLFEKGVITEKEKNKMTAAIMDFCYSKK